jgi:hypothetical protein
LRRSLETSSKIRSSFFCFLVAQIRSRSSFMYTLHSTQCQRLKFFNELKQESISTGVTKQEVTTLVWTQHVFRVSFCFTVFISRHLLHSCGGNFSITTARNAWVGYYVCLCVMEDRNCAARWMVEEGTALKMVWRKWRNRKHKEYEGERRRLSRYVFWLVVVVLKLLSLLLRFFVVPVT